MTTWRKSTRSTSSDGFGDCVEVFGDLESVRDSKNADGPVLRCDVTALVRAIKLDNHAPSQA